MLFKTNTLKNISYSVYTTWRNYSLQREARLLSKILQKGQKKSLKRPQIPKATSMNNYARNTLYSPVKKRTAALNTIFMEYICDLSVHGRYSQELNDLGIQVVEVKLSPNYHVLFVYWSHSKEIDEERVNELLPVVARYIRSELSGMRVMGEIPEVRFVKHVDAVNMDNIQKILKKLSLTSEMEKEALRINGDIEKREENENEADTVSNNVKIGFSNIEDVISYMPENVYGLDRTKMCENIMKEKSKYESNLLQSKRIPQISTDAHETLRFDKKALSKSMFREARELRKEKRLIKQSLGIIDSDDSQEDENEGNGAQDFVEFEGNEEYDDIYVDEDLKRMMNDDDSCKDEVAEPKNPK